MAAAYNVADEAELISAEVPLHEGLGDFLWCTADGDVMVPSFEQC